MRPHTVLLLLCALVAADEVKPCDRSLITGVRDDQIHYDSATKTLTCVDVDGQPTTINYIPSMMRYTSLRCDEVHGWRIKSRKNGAEYTLDGEPGASSPLKISCEKYCLLKTETMALTQYNKATRTLTCNSAPISLVAIRAEREYFESLKCDIKNGMWTARNRPIKDGFFKLSFSCHNYCDWTGAGGVHVERHRARVKENYIELSCFAPSSRLYYAGALIESARCSLTEGWRSADGTPLMGWQSFNIWSSPPKPQQPHFECSKAPPACSFQLAPSHTNLSHHVAYVKIDRRDPDLYLTCRRHGDEAPKAIVVGSERYHALKCDKDNGWTAKSNGAKIADASSLLTISCEESCIATGARITVRDDDPVVTVDCYGQQLYTLLYHDGRTVGRVTCSLSDGWQHDVYPITPLINAVNSKPVHFECVAPPCSFLRPEIDRLTTRHHDTLRCTENMIYTGGDRDRSQHTYLRAIEFNSKRYEFLTCNEEEGWKAGNTKLAEASTLLDINCVEYCKAVEHYSLLHPIARASVDAIFAQCDYDKDELINDGRRVVGNNATCTYKDGWVMGSGVMFSKDIYAPQPFLCRYYDSPSPCTFGEHITNNVALLTTSTHPQTNKWMLSCRNNGDTPHAIEFESKRYASLECDESDKKWKSGNETVAIARGIATFTCVEVPTTTTTSTTSSTTSTSLPVTEPKPVDVATTAELPETRTELIAEAESQTSLVVICSTVGALIVIIIVIAGILLYVFNMKRRRNSGKEKDGNLSGNKNKRNNEISSDIPEPNSGSQK